MPSVTPSFLPTALATFSLVMEHCWFGWYLTLAEVSYPPDDEMGSELDLSLDLSSKKISGLPPPFCAAQ